MNRRRLCRGLSVATFGLAAAFAASPPAPAGASAPAAAAWWYKAYVSSAPAAPPAPPQVPKGGLWVAEDPTGAASSSPAPAPGLPVPVPAPAPAPSSPVPAGAPLAFATVRATLAPGSGAAITLKVGAGSTAQLASIDACPVTSPGSWPASADGGPSPIDRAPSYDCSTAVPGKLAADSSAMTWQLPATVQGGDGTIDVALVPHTAGSTPPLPFEVAFEPPDVSTVSGPAAPPAPTPPPFTPAPAPLPGAGAALPSSLGAAGPLGAAPAGGAFATGATAAAPAPLAQPATAPPPASASQPLAVTPLQAVPVSLLNDHRGQRLMAVTILLLLAVAWWWVGGQPGRGPRFLGRVQREPAGGAGAADGRRGVGRFARPRTAPARPLLG